MNKVITINLGGNACQLEEGGYDLLRAYLETAATRLQNNPDRDEILSDIEGAIAEKFRALLASHKTVVATKEVSAVLAEMGPIDAEEETGDTARPAGSAGSGGSGGSGGSNRAGTAGPEGAGAPKRLYRIYEGAMVSGVCNGIGAYFNIDPTLVRLAFVLLTIFWGMGLLVYVIMAFLVPEARSPEEKAAASGLPATAQEFIRRAKAGYYEAVKNFQDAGARHHWNRWFRRTGCGGAYPWGHSWSSGWTSPAPSCQPWLGFTLPFLSFLSGTVVVVWLCALVSLLATGKIFGLTLPPNVPPWVAAFLLFLAYGLLTGALKTARCLFWWPSGSGARPPAAVVLADVVVWLVVVAVLFLLAVHCFPELHAAVQAIPPLLHQAKDDIQTWWQSK